jgi:hypothetical protein
MSLFPSPLPTQFQATYAHLLKALAQGHQPFLIKQLEGNLYHTVLDMLITLEQKGRVLSMDKVWEASLPELFNFQIHMGVHLQRKLNTFSEPQVLNVEHIKTALNPEHLDKTTGLDLAQDLSHIWVYLSPATPAKILYSVDAVFRGKGPLSLGAPTGEEEHVIRLECVGADLGNQSDWEGAESLAALLEQAERETDLTQAAWEVVDIDHLLAGNPHLGSRD